MMFRIATATDLGKLRKDENMVIKEAPRLFWFSEFAIFVPIPDGINEYYNSAITKHKVMKSKLISDRRNINQEISFDNQDHGFLKSKLLMLNSAEINEQLTSESSKNSTSLLQGNIKTRRYVDYNRINLLQEERLNLISSDQSRVASLLSKGHLLSEKIQTHARSNLLKRPISPLRKEVHQLTYKV